MRPKAERQEFIQYIIDYTNQSITHDAYKGIALYLTPMIYDFYSSPSNFIPIWIIRLSVALICLTFLFSIKQPLIMKNQRFFYMLGMAVAMISITPIWSLSNPDTLPTEATLIAAPLILGMAIFRMLAVDALLLGAIYCGSFCILLLYRNANADIWQSYSIGLGQGYVMGALIAYLSERDLYRSFVTDKLLRQETARADNLLINTFPSEVAKELKAYHRSQPQRFDNVTVMFCDIVSFTSNASSMPPEDLVEWLNQVFSKFDQLTEDYGCEKIKTIGDAYMVVCGAPTPYTDHAQRVVRLAIALNNISKDIHLKGSPLAIRIGINTGPVVAGVIGRKRFAYDLWGDCVNTASRMESLSEPGKILLTESTKDQLDDSIELKKITGINVKGKGQMDAWQVIGYRT